MSDRFFVAGPLAEGPVAITGPEAHHLAQVCRVQAGDEVCLFNGDGRQYRAVVVTASKRGVELDVQGVETPGRELPFTLEAAVPLPKGDRAQFLVEKLTELGVTRLVPLRTARSVVHPGDAKRDKMERWVIEASKQCGRNRLMEIGPLTDWGDYVVATTAFFRYLAHPSAIVKHSVPLSPASGERGGGEGARDIIPWTNPAPSPPAPLPRSGGERSGTAHAIAVGPEGGFTDEEVARALEHGWQGVSLGPRILRVETAAIALAALVTMTAAS